MPNATLLQILDAREKRVELQKQLISAYKTPLICFTMNIAGPQKISPLIERAFFEGLALLQEKFSRNIVYNQKNMAVTGCEAMFCVHQDANEIKNICAYIEDNHPLGRLFDMDVITANGEKLSRTDQRGCIVCGKKGRECAAGRLHSVEELKTVTTKIITDYFLEKDSGMLGDLAVESLICEVYTTPKAGLVDRNNNGSHADMNIELFEKSANALNPYFKDCVKIGYNTRELPCEEAFSHLRTSGILAERIMFEATDDVNTHKGAIFSLGTVCGAIGRLWTAENPVICFDKVFSLCADLVKTAVKNDFDNIDDTTAGGKVYKKFGIKGIRGEAASGFWSVKNISLPIFKKAIEGGFSENDAGAIALVYLISELEDTTIYNRGGKEGADFARSRAKAMIAQSEFPSMQQLENLDKKFIAKNLSAGGCADLLAITYFVIKAELFGR